MTNRVEKNGVTKFSNITRVEDYKRERKKKPPLNDVPGEIDE